MDEYLDSEDDGTGFLESYELRLMTLWAAFRSLRYLTRTGTDD